jgi:cyclic pyranopterin phosphate synthase
MSLKTELDRVGINPIHNSCSDMVKLLITERCNMQCPFCWNPPARKAELTLSEVEDLCNKFRDAGMSRIKICGGAYGEPLLREDIIDVVRTVNNSGFTDIGLATNGRLLNESVVQSLIEAGLTWITHSITTLNSSKYQALYGAELSQESLRAVHSYSGLKRYQVNCVVLSQHNVDEIDDIIDFAHTRGAIVHFMELIGHRDNWTYFQDNYVSLEPLKAKLFERCYEHLYSRAKVAHEFRLPTGIVTLKQTDKEKEGCKFCRRIFVSSEGKIWFCLPENELGDFREVEASSIQDFIDNRYNEITELAEKDRLAYGCDRMCDGGVVANE